MPFIPSNVDQLLDENTFVLKFVFISSLTPDLLLIPKSMPDKIIIILGFFKVFRYNFGRPDMFFNHPESDFILVRSLENFHQRLTMN